MRDRDRGISIQKCRPSGVKVMASAEPARTASERSQREGTTRARAPSPHASTTKPRSTPPCVLAQITNKSGNHPKAPRESRKTIQGMKSSEKACGRGSHHPDAAVNETRIRMNAVDDEPC